MEDAVEEQLIPSDAINSLLNIWDKKKKSKQEEKSLTGDSLVRFCQGKQQHINAF